MNRVMNLVEQHIIKPSHLFYNECDYLCGLSKNLYNKCLFDTRKQFIQDGTYRNYNDNYIELRYKKDYKKLPDKVAKQTLRIVDQNYRSFFRANEKYNKDSGKYKNRPRIPKYLDKNSKYITIYEKGAISIRELRKGYIKLSKTNIILKTNKATVGNIVQTRIVPHKGYYIIEVVYKIEVEKKVDNGNHAAIDLGVSNLSALVFNTDDEPIIFDGIDIKRINNYANYRIGKVQKELKIKNDKYSSKKTHRLFKKRDMKIKDLFHKTSKMIVNFLVENNITVLVVGQNKGWKQNINIGKSNRNFVQIPFDKLIKQLRYKCELVGIEFITSEESYTSKCSFIDNESLKRQRVYDGKRINRDTFISKNGQSIHADINAAYNILRKVVESFAFHGGLAVNPRVIRVYD